MNCILYYIKILYNIGHRIEIILYKYIIELYKHNNEIDNLRLSIDDWHDPILQSRHYLTDNEVIYKMTNLMVETDKFEGMSIWILMNYENFHAITHVALRFCSYEQTPSLLLLSNFHLLSYTKYNQRTYGKSNKLFITNEYLIWSYAIINYIVNFFFELS